MRLLPDRSFDERNPAVIAVIGLAVFVLALVAVVNIRSLPLIGNGTVYQAAFGEAGGLKKGDTVLVAGVKVGEVTDMRLDGNQVVASFDVKDVWVGDESSAAIAVKTLLGQKYLDLTSEGGNELEAGATIPRERTTTPYDVTETLSTLSTTIDGVDTAQLQDSFAALSDTFQNTPQDVRGTLDGLTALSKTVSSRDAEFTTLLDNTRQVSQVLSDRRGQIGRLIQDGNLLLSELSNRRDTIKALLKGTSDLGIQVQGLVADNEKQLQPALANLDTVTKILSDNQEDLERTVSLLGPYYRVLTSALGTGPWLDTYICGLFDAGGAPELNGDAVRDCKPRQPVTAPVVIPPGGQLVYGPTTIPQIPDPFPIPPRGQQ